MKNKRWLSLGILIIGSALIFGGCAETKTVTKKEEAPASRTDKGTEAVGEPKTEVVEPISPAVEGMAREDVATSASRSETMAQAFADVHFEFDRYDIRTEDRPTLNGLADWMVKNSAASLLVEGHCDDRGTNEYNLALGERRATAVKDYLAASGVDRSRISTISYGEERPLDPGQGEAAWAKNRRGHFVISK